MDDRLATLLADLERADSLAGSDLHRAARRAAWLGELTTAQFAELLLAISQLPMPLSTQADRLLAGWLVTAVQARRKAVETARAVAHVGDEQVLRALEPLYRNLASSSRARGQLLA